MPLETVLKSEFEIVSRVTLALHFEQGQHLILGLIYSVGDQQHSKISF